MNPCGFTAIHCHTLFVLSLALPYAMRILCVSALGPKSRPGTLQPALYLVHCLSERDTASLPSAMRVPTKNGTVLLPPCLNPSACSLNQPSRFCALLGEGLLGLQHTKTSASTRAMAQPRTAFDRHGSGHCLRTGTGELVFLATVCARLHWHDCELCVCVCVCTFLTSLTILVSNSTLSVSRSVIPSLAPTTSSHGFPCVGSCVVMGPKRQLSVLRHSARS